ncbi:hypothetical protein F4781DRAFT_445642 [Annulohypoxylon bovei var. microspora]|nr:hypothetical protein F4781DRAFT_445642 [Annulohypoxylon bovei var. microspora]
MAPIELVNAPPQFPDFEIETVDDAERILAVSKKIEEFFDHIEIGEVVPTTTYGVLLKALDWFPYALRRLEGAKDRFRGDEEIEGMIQYALDILETVHPTIEPIINESDEQRIINELRDSDELKDHEVQTNGC